jgi:EpsI family protein
MNSIVSRLAFLIALVAAVHCGFIVIRAGTQNAQVRLPTRSLHELPVSLGNWRGEDTELDPNIFVGTGAREALARSYTDRSGQSASLFLALYDDPGAGVYHTPFNCYRAQGWTNISEVRMPVECPGRPTIFVSLSTWRKSGLQQIQVLCWYEMGEHVLFDRIDWSGGLWFWRGVRFKFRGLTTWPPMYKVLLEAQDTDSLTSHRLVELAASLRGWLGELSASSEPPASAR